MENYEEFWFCTLFYTIDRSSDISEQIKKTDANSSNETCFHFQHGHWKIILFFAYHCYLLWSLHFLLMSVSQLIWIIFFKILEYNFEFVKLHNFLLFSRTVSLILIKDLFEQWSIPPLYMTHWYFKSKSVTHAFFSLYNILT